MPSAGYDTLKEIGKLPLINKYADPFLNQKDTSNTESNTYAEFRQRLMRPIDIFPVKFQVDLGTLLDALTETEPECNKLPVIVDFVKGIVEYNLKLSAIMLCDKQVSGLRVWVNNETQSTDSIQNNYKENKIVETFNNMLTSVSQYNEYMRSIGAITDPTQGAPQNPLAAALLDGRHLSLPKIWEKTDYTPVLNLTVKLISPYGNSKSFIKNIAKPLLYLTALTAPSTYDGVTYGQPSNMYIRAYGVTFIPLAFAESFEVTRGGTNARVNWNKQPLEISVSMSFKPAMPGFAAFLPPNTFNLETGLGASMDTIVNGGLSGAMSCSGAGCIDPIGTIPDLNSDNTDSDLAEIVAGQGTLRIPGVTSLGHIIQSLRPTPADIRTVPPSLLDYYQGNVQLPNANRTAMNNLDQAFVERQYNQVANLFTDVGIPISDDELYNTILQQNQSPTMPLNIARTV